MDRYIPLSKWVEGVDYELVPLPEHTDAWGVRIMAGYFVETVVQYAAVSFNTENDTLNFSFKVHSSPDPEAKPENLELQSVASDILSAILEKGVYDGTVKVTDDDAKS